MDETKYIKSILESRKIIKQRNKENKIREQLTEEEIEKFQKPVVDKVTKQSELFENYLDALPAIQDTNQQPAILEPTVASYTINLDLKKWIKRCLKI